MSNVDHFLGLAQRLKTVVAVPVTPYRPDGAVDLDGLQQNTEFLLQHGVKVVTPCGGTGEFYHLTLDEVRAVISAVAEVAKGRALIMPGVGYSVAMAVEIGSHARAAGAEAVMVHHPIHPYITEAGALAYFQQIAAALPELALVPYKRANTVSDRVLLQLAANPQFAGVKYATNNLQELGTFVRAVRSAGPMAVICGTAETWAPFYWAAGAEGYTSGLVNVAPGLTLDLLAALRAGDDARVQDLWATIKPFEDLRAEEGNAWNVAVVKAAMDLAGLAGGAVRPPMSALEPARVQRVRGMLQEWGVLAPASR